MTKTEHPKTNEILKWFEAISKIPRCSKNEEAIGKWLLDWARERELTAARDDAGNVRIDVPASPGCEDSTTVIIQGHMDMVCQKGPGSDHDFTKDPIRLIYTSDGEWLTADNTTLGADNGIALAMGLVLAEDKQIKHPPLELLFTVDEETGLTGAFAIEPDFVKGKILLNLDSEDEGILTVGCSGGLKSDHRVPLDWEPAPLEYLQVSVSVCGLSGGHSADILDEKENAIRVLGRTLHALLEEVDVRIADISGGSVDNAIPLNAEAVIRIPADSLEKVNSIVSHLKEIVRIEAQKTDPGLDIVVKETNEKSTGETITKEMSEKVIRLLLAMPHGVWAVSREIENEVETSNNFASIRIDNRELGITTSQRSPVATRLDAVTSHIESVVRLAGGSTINRGRYPGWRPDMNSWILKKCIEVYERLYKKKPVVESTHGGLECGVIGSKLPEMDMISMGPTVLYPHSPEEKINIPTIGKVWDFLEAILAEI